jgi:hypothetical protein
MAYRVGGGDSRLALRRDGRGLCAQGQGRHYASTVTDGDDLHVLSRSDDSRAKSAHDGNLVTFHTVSRVPGISMGARHGSAAEVQVTGPRLSEAVKKSQPQINADERR